MRHQRANSGVLMLSVVGAPTSAPQATAQFIGKVVGNRAVGTLTVQRIELRSILAW